MMRSNGDTGTWKENTLGRTSSKEGMGLVRLRFRMQGSEADTANTCRTIGDKVRVGEAGPDV